MHQLWSYWNASREDHFTCSSPESVASALAAKYVVVRPEGEIFTEPGVGRLPLQLFYSEERKDNFTTATWQGVADAKAAGYREVGRIEGYVYEPKPRKPARSRRLWLYWSAERGDNFLLAEGSESEQAAIEAGYVQVRLEGYTPDTRIDPG